MLTLLLILGIIFEIAILITAQRRFNVTEKKEIKRAVSLFVGDKKIPLNPFTQDILSEINIAVINTLKKVTDTDSVQIKISIDPLEKS